MKNVLIVFAAALLSSCAHTVVDSGAKLLYPLSAQDRMVLEQRLTRLEKGMNGKAALRIIGLARCPTPEEPTIGNSSIVVQIGNGYTLHVNFADFSAGGGFISAKIKKESANQTSDGIRQPADGSPKPSM